MNGFLGTGASTSSLARWPLVLVLALSAAACAEGGGSLRGADLSLTPLATIGGAEEGSGAAPSLQLPVYLRAGEGGRLWTLDSSRKGAVALDRSGREVGVAGRPGRGPGEVQVALGIDVSSDGTVWIADPGNAKVVGFRGGSMTGEFLVDHQPIGVVAPDDGTLWVGGDLLASVLVRYDRSGRRLGTAGVPIGRTPGSFRLNQGIAARGTGACAAVWAYTFHSVVECYGSDGRTVWRAEGPVEVRPARDADPMSMSPDERFAYVDVTADKGRVFALFVGGPPGDDGLRTREVHVFDAADGRFAGRVQLPHPAKFILRRDSLLAALDYDPAPLIRLYRVAEPAR